MIDFQATYGPGSLALLSHTALYSLWGIVDTVYLHKCATIYLDILKYMLYFYINSFTVG